MSTPPKKLGLFQSAAVFVAILVGVIVVLVIALIGFAACAGPSNTSSSSPTTTSKVDRFLQVIHDQGIVVSDSDAKIIAQNVCNTFERRVKTTKSEVIMALAIKQNWEPGNAASFASAAVNTFCPEYDRRPFE